MQYLKRKRYSQADISARYTLYYVRNHHLRIAHAYAGLDVPELDRVKVPGAPNTKRAMHFYMKAAKQGRFLGAKTLSFQDEFEEHAEN